MNLLLLSLFYFYASCCKDCFTPNRKAVISKLVERIEDAQIKTSTTYNPKFIYPPRQWTQQKGLFDSQIHVNVYGNHVFDAIRKGFHFPDNNGFVTMFVIEALVESDFLLNGEFTLHRRVLIDAVTAIGTHVDKNAKDDESVIAFWNQIPDGSQWKSWPDNIGIPFSTFDNGTTSIASFLTKLGIKKAAKVSETVHSVISFLLGIFNIPGDADDTGCNLAMGMNILKNSRAKPADVIWLGYVGKDLNVFNAYVKYAYRPLSGSVIDPRSYFWLHEFLKLHRNEPVALIATWLTFNVTQMPFGLNNIDLSVVANALYGITKTLLTREKNPKILQKSILDEGLENLYFWSVELLVWSLENNILQTRPDLILLYYPSVLNFYMMAGRLVHELYRETNIQILLNARIRLGTCMRSFGVSQVLELASAEADDTIFWSDGILASGDDNMFATAAAINALTDTFANEKYTSLDESAPEAVKTHIEKALAWLNIHGKSRENVFFSSSTKGFPWGFPSLYPSNYFAYRNNATTVDGEELCKKNLTDLSAFRIGVQGYFPDFEAGLNKTCGGSPVPVDFPGYLKCKNCFFPYWSSPAVTDSFWLLAIAKSSVLVS